VQSEGMDTATGEVTELLQQLIRNACVNDGTPESGQETRSADLLESYLEGSGLDLQRFEPLPGRGSLVARIEGTDPQAPSLLLMGHMDVVPVNPDNWHEDPFAGELKDGVVWGRGAIDMLNLTASMAVATKRFAASGRRPRGSLVYLGVADIPSEMPSMLREPANVRQFVETTDDLGMARMIHACTHTTFAPTVIHGGIKTNVIPDTVELDVDIRTLPGQRAEDIRAMLDEALGDLADQVEIAAHSDDPASSSPADTPLY